MTKNDRPETCPRHKIGVTGNRFFFSHQHHCHQITIFVDKLSKFFSGSLLLGNTVWAQLTEHTVFINAGQEKVQCFPDDMTSSLIGESSLKVMTALF